MADALANLGDAGPEIGQSPADIATDPAAVAQISKLVHLDGGTVPEAAYRARLAELTGRQAPHL
jgi:hypothetical protein